MTDLLVMVPTRGRRAQCERLLKSFQETASDGTDLLFIVDVDDQDSYEGMDWGDALTAVLDPRAYTVGKLNKTAMSVIDAYDVIMWAGNDHVFSTPGWDKLMLATLKGLGKCAKCGPDGTAPDECPGHGWVYPDDKRRSDVPEIWMCTTDVVKTLGYFANPAVQHYYCVVPETLVLTSSLDWVPISKLDVGDELIGVDEFPSPGRTRKYRRSEILARTRRIADCVTVSLDDGRQITCSAEHMFLVQRAKGQFVDSRCRFQDPLRAGRGGYQWIEAGRLRPGDPISAPLRTWERATTFEAGWLSGMFDGEGSIRYLSGKFPNPALTISQNPGPVLDRLEASLKSMGTAFKRYKRDASRDNCALLSISPRAEAIELMGRLQPTRLKYERLWENSSVHHGGMERSLALVADVRSVGSNEVISLSTSTKTLLTNGLVSHNCDNSIAELAKRAGLIRWCPEAVVDHRHYSVTPETERDELYAFAEDMFGQSDLAAFRKWQAERLPVEVAMLRREYNPDVSWVLSKI